jgi:hypothetical protein
MKGLFSILIRNGVNADDGEYLYRPRKEFTRQDIGRIAERGASEFRDRAMNLISCFGPLDGEFGLYSALSNFIQTKGALTNEINDAVQDGDEIALTETFVRAMQFSFVTLYEKNALSRLQLVENLPAEAAVEFARMRQSVASAIHPTAPAAAKAPVVPVVTETPVEVAAREWKELSGDQFRVKYLNHQGNRKFYEQALAQGLIS